MPQFVSKGYPVDFLGNWLADKEFTEEQRLAIVALFSAKGKTFRAVSEELGKPLKQIYGIFQSVYTALKIKNIDDLETMLSLDHDRAFAKRKKSGAPSLPTQSEGGLHQNAIATNSHGPEPSEKEPLVWLQWYQSCVSHGIFSPEEAHALIEAKKPRLVERIAATTRFTEEEVQAATERAAGEQMAAFDKAFADSLVYMASNKP